MNKKELGIKLLIIAEVIVLLVVLVLGGLKLTVFKDKVPNPTGTQTSGELKQNNISTSENGANDNAIASAGPRMTFSDAVEAKLAEMTLEEKVAQVFLVSTEELTGQAGVTMAGEGTKSALNTYPVGGIVYESSNMVLPDQMAALTANAQTYSQERIGLELFTAVAEEGGQSSPVATVRNQGMPEGAGAISDSAEATASASEIGNYLQEYGFNMNLAPVADVAEESDDSTFGTDPDVVGELVGAQVVAYQQAGITAVLKYFPGTSAVTESETGLPVCSRSLEQLQVKDFIAYQAGIDAGAQAIMLGHVACVGITGSQSLSCSLSSGTVKILREDLGYEGIIISDRLDNETVIAAFPDGSAAVEALKAGVDMLYHPGNLEVSYQAVLDAVNSGKITQDRLDEAVGRILSVKLD
ncbi:MAG: glycoside hydrolase family 3 N-terminal domain-containing protein [Agathobacter sp.]